MLELVERKAGGISWPRATPPSNNKDNNNFGNKEPTQLARRKPAGKRGGAEQQQWVRRSSRGLLCSLGGCEDYYSPDTIGTWKFHRVSRAR